MKPSSKPAAKRTVNKSAFVRSLDPSMTVGEVVKTAAAQGMKLSDQFVYTIRYNAKKAAEKGGRKTSATSSPAAAPAKRGPGRPRESQSSAGGAAPEGLVDAIERIVEAKVSAMLRERLAGLFGA